MSSRPTLLLVAAVCAAPLVAAVRLDGQDAFTAAVGVPLLAAAAWAARTRPLAATAVPVALALAADPELLAPEFWPALALFGYLAGNRAHSARPALWFFAGVAACGLPVCAFVARELWAWPSQLLALLLAVGLPWFLGRHRRQYAELASTGWKLAEEMERRERTVADRARLRERARIAGDMHDSLGHDLTLLAVRAGALQVDPALEARHQAAAGELREAAAQATARLRDIIGLLREDDDEYAGRTGSAVGGENGEAGAADQENGAADQEKGAAGQEHGAARAGGDGQPGDGQPPGAGPVSGAYESTAPDGGGIEDLVRGARASGLTVALEGAREAAGLPPRAARAAYRVVREALTNAAKHAPGAEVRVRLVREAAGCTVTVGNGPPPGGALPGVASGGTGLVGLDERVRLAGGTLRAGPAADGGFEVAATLPADPDAAPRARPPATEAARERDRVRREVRRSLLRTALGPVAVLTGILVLMIPVSLISSSLSVLDSGTFDQLRPGMPRDRVEDRLPLYTRDGPPDGAPRTPRGQECVYYGTGVNSSDAYRLCFAHGELRGATRVGHDR